jgi:hypothetical protein
LLLLLLLLLPFKLQLLHAMPIVLLVLLLVSLPWF